MHHVVKTIIATEFGKQKLKMVDILDVLRIPGNMMYCARIKNTIPKHVQTHRGHRESNTSGGSGPLKHRERRVTPKWKAPTTLFLSPFFHFLLLSVHNSIYFSFCINRSDIILVRKIQVLFVPACEHSCYTILKVEFMIRSAGHVFGFDAKVRFSSVFLYD